MSQYRLAIFDKVGLYAECFIKLKSDLEATKTANQFARDVIDSPEVMASANVHVYKKIDMPEGAFMFKRVACFLASISSIADAFGLADSKRN